MFTGNYDFSNKHAVVVRDNLHAGSTGCQGAASLSADFGSDLVLDGATGKHYFEFDFNKTVAGADGRVETELNDGEHDDLTGTALPESTFTFCMAPQNDHDEDSDYSVHFSSVKLFSQYAARLHPWPLTAHYARTLTTPFSVSPLAQARPAVASARGETEKGVVSVRA